MPRSSRRSSRNPAEIRRDSASETASDTASTQTFPDEKLVMRIIAESERAIREPLPGSSSSFARYVHELQRYPVLTPQQERELAVQAQRGSIEAQEALVRHNLRFVITVARKHATHDVPLEDLVQEGNIGLLRAVTKFRPEYGVRFVTYAVHWIRQSIRAALATQQRAVRLPLNRATQLARIRRAMSSLQDELGRPPTAKEIAQAVDVPIDIVEALLFIGQNEISLDLPPGSEEDRTSLSERLSDGEILDAIIERRCRRQHIEKVLSRLRERDALVLKLFYGLGDNTREHTLEEIGQILGITRERVRQIRDRALRQLKTRHGAALRDYAGTYYPEGLE